MEEQVELQVPHRQKYEAPSIESTAHKKSTQKPIFSPLESGPTFGPS